MKNIKLCNYRRDAEWMQNATYASEIAIYLRVTLINDRRQDFEAP